MSSRLAPSRAARAAAIVLNAIAGPTSRESSTRISRSTWAAPCRADSTVLLRSVDTCIETIGPSPRNLAIGLRELGGIWLRGHRVIWRCFQQPIEFLGAQVHAVPVTRSPERHVGWDDCDPQFRCNFGRQ